MTPQSSMALSNDPKAWKVFARNIGIVFRGREPTSTPWFFNNNTACQRVLTSEPMWRKGQYLELTCCDLALMLPLSCYFDFHFILKNRVYDSCP